MGSHTKKEIYPLGGRRPAPQAGAWSYSRRESGTDWQEGDDFSLGGGPRMKPHNRQWCTSGAPDGKVKLALSSAEGGAFQFCQAFLAMTTSLVSGGF